MKAGTPGEAICDELTPMARDIGRGTVHVRWRHQRDTLPWCRSMTAASCPTASEHRVVGRTPEAQALLTQLTTQDAKLADAIALAYDVAPLVRQQPPEPLDPWPARAAESPLLALQRCA